MKTERCAALARHRGAALKYPSYPGHEAQHERFMREIEKVSAEHKRAHLEPMRVAALLRCWMTDHVSLTDQQLALFVSAMRRRGA